MSKITFRLVDGTTATVDERDVDYNKPMEGFISVWIADENVIRIWPARQIEQIEIKPERLLKVIETEAA
ncbi:MAG: hypothetical protein IBX64_08210 [Actinobacteria bacterium]|nr:hypothetical protein [Actinomycetota bacterium]